MFWPLKQFPLQIWQIQSTCYIGVFGLLVWVPLDTIVLSFPSHNHLTSGRNPYFIDSLSVSLDGIIGKNLGTQTAHLVNPESAKVFTVPFHSLNLSSWLFFGVVLGSIICPTPQLFFWKIPANRRSIVHSDLSSNLEVSRSGAKFYVPSTIYTWFIVCHRKWGLVCRSLRLFSLPFK